MSTGVTGMFGAYELRGLIGRGGMGEVYRAYDTRRGREVALKLLTPETDPALVERFRREARALVRLSDPNIVPVYDFGEIDGRLFIDMALIDGRDLAAVLRAAGRMPPERAVRVLGQAARALDTAHRHGVVHRDVKPPNLLILTDRDDFTYLVDFGIASAIDDTSAGASLTGTGMAVGTMAYISPEQIRGDRVDGRADVYALACVLFEMLTGQRPFPFDGPAALMNAHLHAPPPRVTALRPELPAAWDAVIARGMTKSPDGRPSTARALHELAREVPGRPPPPVPASRPPSTRVGPPTRLGGPAVPPPPPPPGRSLRPAILIGLGAIVATVAVLVATVVVSRTGSGGGTEPDPPTTTAQTAGDPTTAFRTHRDSGFAYSIDVPEALSQEQTVPGGTRFTGPDADGVLETTARIKPEGTPTTFLADALREATGGGGRATLQTSNDDSYTGSGFDATGAIFYFHARVSDRAVVTAFWLYPASEKARWDVAVARSASSLRFDPS